MHINPNRCYFSKYVFTSKERSTINILVFISVINCVNCECFCSHSPIKLRLFLGTLLIKSANVLLSFGRQLHADPDELCLYFKPKWSCLKYSRYSGEQMRWNQMQPSRDLSDQALRCSLHDHRCHECSKDRHKHGQVYDKCR